jgi:FMN reductase
MSEIILLSGSPAERSKSQAILVYVQKSLSALGVSSRIVGVRDFPAEDLMHGKYESEVFIPFKAELAKAKGVVLATPIYKGAYSGSLKALLDILPQYALKEKTVLPVATAGSMAHLLAIDYSIKPVLSVLGASDILQGVYIPDSHFSFKEENQIELDAELQNRLDVSLQQLVEKIRTVPFVQKTASVL